MAANLTPQYYKAEEVFKAATTHEERVSALEEMIRLIPKHKGTDQMQADLKKKLSRLKKGGDPAAAKKKSFNPFSIERGGAGQVPLLGPPNGGKSSLLQTLTRAKSEVAPYPFTTQNPVPGMMAWEDVQVQIVDLPPVSDGQMPPGMLGLVKGADAVLCVIDLAADDMLEQTEQMFACLEAGKLKLHTHGEAAPDLPDEPGWRTLPGLLVGTRADLPAAGGNAEALTELFDAGIPLLSVSTETGEGIEELRGKTYAMLDMMRVYGKAPGKEPDMSSPFVLPLQGTLEDFARLVHRDLAEKLKTARLWGRSAKFDGQVVPRGHVLADGDVVELNVRV